MKRMKQTNKGGYLYLFLLLLLNVGCANQKVENEAKKYISMSDFSPTMPNEPLGPEHGLRFDWQLAKLQLDSLVREGAKWCFPAAVVQARTKENRIAKELEANLLLDAANDLIILRKNLALLEQQLDYVRSQTRCNPPAENTLNLEISTIDKLIKLLNVDNQFATDSTEINPKYMRNLADAASILKQQPSFKLNITGHADMSGSDEYNQKLAMGRAKQVKRYLIILGLAPARMHTYAVGESLPLFEGNSDAIKLTNRRVSIDIISNLEKGEEG